MEPHELAAAGGQKCPNKEPVREKVPLQRKWASEPSAASKRSTFADPAKRHSHRESLHQQQQCGGGPAMNSGGKLLLGPSGLGGAVGGGPPPSSQDSFAQGFPHRGYPYQLGQPPYPQHPQAERFLSGAKPQPGLEPHAWPFAGQLPSDDLYPTTGGHSAAGGGGGGHGASGGGGGRFPRQKSPSLPSSFGGGQYGQSVVVAEDVAEGYGSNKKEQKPKKPGKYICHYCGRACAKPSVLKKHIRSHTGERPYPCVPCGFSFKTKSNLYKHRKSHAHAIKAGLVPFSELSAAAAGGRGGEADQASSVGEAEAHSDGEQSTDTDEEGAVEGSTALSDHHHHHARSPIPQISFEADKSTGGVEPAYADPAEELTSVGSMKVPILIVPQPGVGGVPSPSGMDGCPPFPDMNPHPHPHPHHHPHHHHGMPHHHHHHHHPAAHPGDDSPTIKQRLLLRLTEKKSQDADPPLSSGGGGEQSLNLLSPHSKGSTDSGYFSRSESAEQQISPPNANVKSYEEIMFGRTWYYRPTRSRQSITVGMAGGPLGSAGDPAGFAGLKASGAVLDMGKIAEDRVFFRGDNGDPKQYPTGPCQSSTGLLEPPSDSGPLVRSNSMPTASPTNLNVPPGIRVSHSFDEMMTSDDVFYPAGLRRLRRQAAFEHSAHEASGGEGGEAYGHVPKNALVSSSSSAAGLKMGERSPGVPEHAAYGPYGTKVGMSEISNRKRRKEKSVGDEEDSPGHCDSSCSGSVEMAGDYEYGGGNKPGSLDSSRGGKGSLYGGGSSAHSQSDSFDTCASMCSEDMAFLPDVADSRKGPQAGNVISVIQHTNSLSRPNSFEKSESFEQVPGYQTSAEKALQYSEKAQYSEQSDTEVYEDALSPEGSTLMMRTESSEREAGQSDSDLASMGSCCSSAAASPAQAYHHVPPSSHKLVRQPNIQVPEIRVTTEEPDRPDKEAEAAVSSSKEPEKQQQQQQQQQQHVVEEFQLPQRSDTLSQMPSEKLPPKKKRLRLADMEHSSGESSFESTCTSLSRSPSQESNLSHSSSFSMSFEREEALKSVSPTKQDESCGGAKQSEFLTVPGAGHSSHHQQREMRRSSSEQAPCVLPSEPPEVRSKSFDYGSLSPSSRQGELYCSASAMKERRRGYLVRQASLSVYPETVVQEAGGAELSIKQESCEHGLWTGPTGPGYGGSDLTNRTKRLIGSGGLGCHQQHHQHQHLLQHSISEDSLQDEPLCQSIRSQHRLQAQGSSSEGEYQDAVSYQQQPGLLWNQPDSTQRPRQHLSFQAQQQQQFQKLHSRPPGGSMAAHTLHKQQQQQQQHQAQPPHALQHVVHEPGSDGKPEPTLPYPPGASFPSRASPHSQQQQQPQPFGSSLSSSLSSISSSTTITSSTLLQQTHPVFATQAASLPGGTLVPVRVQTHVPSFGSVMYTSVSQLMANNHGLHGLSSAASSGMGGAGGGGTSGFNLAHFLGQHEGAAAVAAALLRYPPWKPPDVSSSADQTAAAGQNTRLNTGIPLSLTSSTIATTDAGTAGSGGSGGGSGSGSKRMLSPASSLELFVETKQQKRVKEERMYGQIVKEMSAVELSSTAGATETTTTAADGRQRRGALKSEDSMDDADRMSSSPSPPPHRGGGEGGDPPVKIAVPVRSSAPHLPDVPPAESFTPPLQIVTDSSPSPVMEKDGGRESPEDLDVDEKDDEDSPPGEPRPSPSSSSSPDDNNKNNNNIDQRIPISMLVQLAANQNTAGAGAGLLTELADAHRQLFRFPSLRTATSVSWCFLNYTKPSGSSQLLLGLGPNNNSNNSSMQSVYASWSVSSYNPNPLGLSTKASLALLRSKQRAYSSETTYTTAAMSPPTSGKLVSSVAWRLRFDQLKPELMPVDVSKLGRKMKGVVSRERSKEEQGEKEASSKQTPAEPTRIKIFEGGYKSNEDYVYVRGRGRGKYICEECGIRCKKPSMLKKHIRTHTDVRPYVCKFCNFAFKTKGNLTKHMKSKAHMKKCLELGVSVSSVDDIEADDVDVGEEGQRACGKVMSDHQFSDADDSDGGEEDDGGDDDDDDDDDDYGDGDSTPRTRSRSTSPQPYGLPAMSVTSVAASPNSHYHHHHPHHHLLHQHQHHSATELLGTNNKPQLFGYFTTLPSIQITPQGGDREAECQQGVPVSSSSSSMDEDLPIVPSPDPSSSSLSPSSRLSSPGLDPASCPSPLSPGSSPSSRRYLSPHRDLSPRGGRRLSPRRDISPLRHISPKRADLGLVGGGGGFHRRDLSPRRELSSSRGLLAALSPRGPQATRPASPGGGGGGGAGAAGGRDYKRDLSPRGRHRGGMIRALSPRRGLHHHHQHQSHQAPVPLGSVWSLRQGYQAQGHMMTQGELAPLGQQRRASTDMETEQRVGSPSPGEQQASSHANLCSPPRPVLFSHLPLHSQLQVRSPFPMIPIGGIQMVHSVPTSVTSGHAHAPSGHAHGASGHAPSSQRQQPSPRLQKSTSEESNANDIIGSSSRREGPSRDSSQEERMTLSGSGGRGEEECIRTCTDAIASLCIDPADRGGGGGGGVSSPAPSPLPFESQRGGPSSACPASSFSPRPAPSPPQGPGGPGVQHFRSPHPSPDPHGPPRPSSSSSSPCSSPSLGTAAETQPPPPPLATSSKPPHLRGPKPGAAAS